MNATIRFMKTLTLTANDRAELRARAHALHPVVMIGADGLTPAVVKEVEAALKAHELIKIRVFGDDREQRIAIYERVCSATGAAPVQHIGKLLVLYKPRPDEPKTSTRADKKMGPKVVKVVKPSKSGKRRPTVKKMTVLGNQRVTAGGNIKKAKPRQKSVKKTLA
jgi:putative YhbY family RNA-binding protein